MNSPLKHRWRVVQFLNYSPSTLKYTSLNLTTLPKANLYAGCNQIIFSVNTEAQGFIVSNIISTRMRMECIHSTLEADLLSALRHAKAYQLSGNLLKIQTHKNQTIVLSRNQ